MLPPGAWLKQTRRASARELHMPWPDEQSRTQRIVAVCEPTLPVTLVLGSSQPDPRLDSVETERRGVVTARRESGGGAVLVSPGAQIWVDVWLPRGDELWEDDILRSSFWLGAAWMEALRELGVSDLAIHTGRLVHTRWSDAVCFAGTGPGEVSAGGRKLVGIAQRRTRDGGRFHTVCPVDPFAESLVRLFDLDPGERRDLEALLEARATCLRDLIADFGPDRAALLERVVRSIVSFVERAG
jgi:lipoate-protein ligase A